MAKKTIYPKCPVCGATDSSCDNGQWFCMNCGMEVPAPKEETIDKKKEIPVWFRIGFTIPLTIEDLEKLNDNDDEVIEKIRQKIADGTAKPDGDCYVPEDIWDDKKYKDVPEDLKKEYDFDL